MWRKQVYSSWLLKIAIVRVDISEELLFVWVLNITRFRYKVRGSSVSIRRALRIA